jgi:hypothetical protein
MLENYILLNVLSQNIPRGQKPFLRVSINDIELSSTICSSSNMFWTKVFPRLSLMIFSNVFKLLISKSCFYNSFH